MIIRIILITYLNLCIYKPYTILTDTSFYMKYFDKIFIKSSLLVIGHILSILLSYYVLTGIAVWLFHISIPFPEIFANDFLIIGSIFFLPIISALLFVYEKNLINRVLSILYFLLWILGIYNILFCNC
jgi:hypothetical protein